MSNHAMGVSMNPLARQTGPTLPWGIAWRASGASKYERTASAQVMQQEIPAIEALLVQRARVGSALGWTSLAAFLGGLPATFAVAELIDDDYAPFTIALFVALFVATLAAWWVMGPAEMDRSRFEDLRKLLAQLRLASGSEVTVKLLGSPEGRWLELSATLISGVGLSVSRERRKTFVSQTRTGNTIRTTYSITADDTVALRFDHGRFPQATVEAAAALLRVKLGPTSGGRLSVRGTATELSLTFPAVVQPVVEKPSRSMPPLIRMLHGLLDSTPILDENGTPPALPHSPAVNGGLAGLFASPLGLSVTAAVLLVAVVGLPVGGAALFYGQQIRERSDALWAEEDMLRSRGGYGYGYGRYVDPVTQARLDAISAERRSLREQREGVEVASLLCGAAGCTASLFAPFVLLGSGLGVMRRLRL